MHAYDDVFLPFLIVRSIASPKKIKFSNLKSASFSFQFCDKKLRLEFTLKKTNLPQFLGHKTTKKTFGKRKKERKKKEKALQKVQLSFSHPK
jgi:hypothetical protein